MNKEYIDRFHASIEKIGGCWIWTKAKTWGYGILWVDGRNERVHRFSWIIYRGKIPTGFSVLHKCRKRACANPKHLYLSDNPNDAVIRIDPKERFFKKVYKTDSCWLWTATYHSRYKYGLFGYKGKYTGAHRFSWIIHNGEIPNGLFVLHKCDVKACVNPDHLFLGTAKENCLDAMKKGITPLGENHGMVKLSDEKVINIRKEYVPRKITLHFLAKKYGVDYTTIHLIVRGKKWKHLLPR